MAMNSSSRIPGLEDLLRPSHKLTPEACDKIERAACNATEAIVPGIRAIGELLWRAADSDNDVDMQTLFRIGVLLVHLAEYHDLVDAMHSNAVSQARHNAVITP